MGRMDVSEYDQELPQSHPYCRPQGNICRLGSFLGVQNFGFQYFGGFSEKMNILGVMKILWTFLGESSQNWTIFRGNFYAF